MSYTFFADFSLKRFFSLPQRTFTCTLLTLLCFGLSCLSYGESSLFAPQAHAASTKLFGSIEFKGSMKGLTQWLNVQKRHYKNNILKSGSKLNSGMTWDALKKKVEGKDPLTQIKIVNSFWNQWPYKQDPRAYKSPDYWATPAEFKKISGDCEDYAIAKYFTLRSFGFPMEKMRIVVVKDTILRLAHAILAVYIDGDVYILDNLSRNVLSHGRIRNYVPQYSVNEKNRWMHVMPKKK